MVHTPVAWPTNFSNCFVEGRERMTVSPLEITVCAYVRCEALVTRNKPANGRLMTLRGGADGPNATDAKARKQGRGNAGRLRRAG